MLKRNSIFRQVFIFALFVLQAQTVLAEDKSRYDRVNFTVEASAEASNDTLVAMLYAQREGSELAALANEVNKTITQAVKRSKKVPGIHVQTRAYQTYPTYQNQRLTAWRVRQSIQLKSKNIDALSKLIGELQSTLAVESLAYTVSPAQRAELEERLIGEAIAAFQKRAKQITQHLGRSTYRLVTMDVRTTGALVQPIRMRAATKLMETKVAPPTIEPGTQSLTVKASGVIELVVK